MALSSAHTISLRDALEVIPHYDGNNVPFSYFSRGCNEAKTMLPPEAEINLVKLIRIRLSGEPRRTIEDRTFNKLSELLSYLRRIFGNSKSYHQLQGELGCIYQKKTESVISYATRTKNLGREIQETYESTYNNEMSNLTKILIEKEMIRCFINGLLPEIEQRMRDYESIDETIQEAINIETRLLTISSSRRRNEINNPYSQEEFISENCQICLNSSHSAINCSYRYQNASENSGNNLKFNVITCQICNKQGHTASKCRLNKYRGIEEQPVRYIRKNVNCQMCNSYGHTAEKCLQSQRLRTFAGIEKQICQLCHQHGHTADRCRKSLPLRSSQDFKTPRYSTRKYSEIQPNNSVVKHSLCQLCRQTGRSVDTCFHKNKVLIHSSEEVFKCKYCKESGHVIENCIRRERADRKKLEQRNEIDRQVKSLDNGMICVKIIDDRLRRETEEENIVRRDKVTTQKSLLEAKTLNRDGENRFDIPEKLSTLKMFEKNRESLNDSENKQEISQMTTLNKEENVESESKIEVISQGFVEGNVDINLKIEGKINSSTHSEHSETPFVIRDDMYLHPGIQIHDNSNQSGQPETSVRLGDDMKSHQNVQNHGVFNIEIKKNNINLQKKIYGQDDSQENRSPTHYGNINERENEIQIKSDSSLLSEKCSNNSTSQRESVEKDKIKIESNEDNIDSQCVESQQGNIKSEQNYCNIPERINARQSEILNKCDSVSLLEKFTESKNKTKETRNKSSPHVRFKEVDQCSIEINGILITFSKIWRYDKTRKDLGMLINVQISTKTSLVSVPKYSKNTARGEQDLNMNKDTESRSVNEVLDRRWGRKEYKETVRKETDVKESVTKCARKRNISCNACLESMEKKEIVQNINENSMCREDTMKLINFNYVTGTDKNCLDLKLMKFIKNKEFIHVSERHYMFKLFTTYILFLFLRISSFSYYNCILSNVCKFEKIILI